MTDDALSAEKSLLRASCYARRSAVGAKAAAAAANEVAGRAASEIDLSALAITPDTVVSAYWPLAGELDPRPALKALGGRGAKLALPRVVGPGQPLAFHLWRPDDPLIEGRFRVMEPAADSPQATPDILLVPLLAFDSACRRLGHGKGYYDRTLAKLRRATPGPIAIGVAFAAQEVARVPTNEHDQTLDMVITEQGVRKPARAW
jgi:5-formyltetrahydrofolate cyclo-ligase